MTAYERHEKVVNISYDTFVEADTELINEYRCDSDNKETRMTPGQKTMETETQVNTTEQKTLTSFTIDAILSKTGQKTGGKKHNHSLTYSDNNQLKQYDDDIKSHMRCAEDDNRKLCHHEHHSLMGTISTSSCEDDVLTNNHNTKSNVFFDNAPTGSFLWTMPTPLYPLYPFSFHDMSPGLTNLYQVPPTTSATSLTCFPSLHANLAPPIGYFMLDQNENSLKPKSWDSK